MTQDQALILLTEFVSQFETKTSALKKLNSILDSKYDVNRLGQWRRGEQKIPKIVIGFLVGVSISD